MPNIELSVPERIAEIGYSTLEREFLADILLPNDTVLGAWILPQLDKAYKTGTMPPMLPEGRKQ